MKTLLFSLFFILISLCCYSQTPPWQWAVSGEGIYEEKGMGITTDLDGNVLVTGFFYASSITLGSIVLTNAGDHDIFIVKYDPSGNVLWAKSYGGSGNDKAMSIATNDKGNIFLAGHFTSSSLSFGTTTLNNNGNYDIFVAQFDSAGNALWASSSGGTNDDMGYAIATNDSGNVFVSGYFSSSSLGFGGDTLTNVDSSDIFIVKYDSSGNALWARSGGGTGMDYSYNSLTSDAGGNVFITGFFSSPVLSFDSINLSNAGKGDIFIVKYDASGNVLWAKSAGGTNDDACYDIATDISGNAFITGYFSSASISFDSITLQNNIPGFDRILIVKFDPSGNAVWAKRYGGNGTDRGYAIANADSGNIVVAGFQSSSLLQFGSTTLTNAGSIDIFVVKLKDSGTALWAKSGGGTGYDFVMDIAFDANENTFVTGYFYSPALSFDSIVVTNTSNDWFDDFYVAKIGFPAAYVTEEIYSSEFGIYPNPATNQILIQGNFILPGTIEMYDITGRKIFQSSIYNPQSAINISYLSKGIYIYEIRNGKQVQRGKLVKE